jgi:peptidoglycan-N-acetylglucosamine deacetylase
VSADLAVPRKSRRRRLLFAVAVLTAGGLAFVVTQPLWAFDVLAWAMPGIVWRVETREPFVALTFDDGPAPDHTPRVLEILARHEAHATFFLIGDRAARYPKSVDELRGAGHEVGNHSYTLRSTLRASDEEFVANLERTESVLRMSGPMKLFRPPGGKIRAAQIRIAHERGYRVVLGSAYPYDGAHPPSTYIEWLVRKNLAPGVIVILHDGIADPSRSIAALEGILVAGERKGLRFVTVGQLLGTPSRTACYDPGRNDCGPSLGLPLAAARSLHGGGARR